MADRLIATQIALADTWTGGVFVSGETRRLIAAAAITAFDKCREPIRDKKPDKDLFRYYMEAELKKATAIPAIISWLVIKWLIGMLLDYLWDNWR